jgi:sugar/nucleoside kinase (ribokinase family)
LAEGPKYLIVKYGEKGSRLYTREGKIYNVGVYKTQAKDTTGAGDSFLGGLCAHLSHLDKVSDEALLQGMKLGAAAASFTVEAFGVERLINVGKEQIEARLKEVA